MTATAVPTADQPPTEGAPAPPGGGFGRQLMRNSLAMLSVQIIGWLLNLVVTFYLPRYLGATNTGIFYLVASMLGLADLGNGLSHSTPLVKAIARDSSLTGRLLSNGLAVRTVVSGLVVILLPLLLAVTGYSQDFIILVIIAAVGMLLTALGEQVSAAYQGLQWMGTMSIITIIGRFMVAFATLALIFLQRPILDFITSVIPIALFGLVLLVYVLMRRGYRLQWPDLATMRSIVVSSLPFLVSGASIVLYLQLNPILLERLADLQSVGLYGVGMRLAGTMMLVPSMLIGAAMPLMARLFLVDQMAMMVQARRVLLIFLICSTQPMLIFWFYGGEIATLLFGSDFTASGPVLQVLGLALVATYLNTYVGAMLQAMDRQKIWATVMIVATLLALPINTAMISVGQHYGSASVGAAIGFLVTEIGMTVPGFIILSRWQLGKVCLQVMSRAALATLATAALLLVMAPLLPFFVAIPVAGLVYLAAGWLFRVVPPEEVALAYRLLRQMIVERRLPFRGRA